MDALLGKPLFLVVEDERDIREPLRANLESQGWDCLAVGSVAEAKTILEQNKVSIVILDWGLEGGTGEDVLKYIRERDPLLPVIVQSGLPPDATRIDSLLLMADGFLAKPFSLQVLNMHLRQWLRRLAAMPQQLLPRSPEEIRPLSDVRYEYVAKSVNILGGNISAAARKLEIERHTINSILNRSAKNEIQHKPMI